MSRPSLAVIVSSAPEGGNFVACPAPGRVRFQRRKGEVITAGSRVGILVENERNFDLVLPPGAIGEILEVFLANPWTACVYGQPLARLVAPTGLAERAAKERASEKSDLFDVISPTHGTFYRRPSPDSPPYVEVDQEITRGQTLGLVEVMKCFSPITFDPPAGCERARVMEVAANDGAEVRTEQPLLRLQLLT